VHVELERIWEEVIMTYFEVLFHYFPAQTEISQSTSGRMIAFVLNEIQTVHISNNSWYCCHLRHLS